MRPTPPPSQHPFNAALAVREAVQTDQTPDPHSSYHVGFPPMVFFFVENPIQVILFYALLSALFMPFLAGTLLYMNSRRDWVGDELRNGWISRLWLSMCLGLFVWLAWRDIGSALDKL